MCKIFGFDLQDPPNMDTFTRTILFVALTPLEKSISNIGVISSYSYKAFDHVVVLCTIEND